MKFSVHRYIVTTMAALLQGAGRICPENWKLLVLLKTRESQLWQGGPPTDYLASDHSITDLAAREQKTLLSRFADTDCYVAPLKVRGFGFIGHWTELSIWSLNIPIIVLWPSLKPSHSAKISRSKLVW